MKIEREFFLPYIAGNLGNSLQKAQELQRKLTEFIPIAKVVNFDVFDVVWCLFCGKTVKTPPKNGETIDLNHRAIVFSKRQEFDWHLLSLQHSHQVPRLITWLKC